MDRHHHLPNVRQREHVGSSSPQLATPNDADMALNSLNNLSLAIGSATSALTPSPSPSPLQSPSPSLDRNGSHHRHDSPSRAFNQRPGSLRRTPSSASLRDDRMVSTPSLQKRLSMSSLRSVQVGGVPTSRPSLSRRSSANFVPSPSSNMRSYLPTTEASGRVSVPTASSIASEHFRKELALHQSTDLQSKTVVIIQDACYGHRFSRPRTSKAGLELIVERPERIQASILGIATAYVRMGKRYEGGRFAPRPGLDLKLLPIPPFQIRKTTRSMPLNSPAVTHVHGAKWMDELKAMCDAAEFRLALNGKELVRPSSSGRDDNSVNHLKLHEGDLYLCSESLNAFEGALGGVCEGVDAVFTPGSTRRAFVCIRPPGHHCSSDYPSGFCWLNNVHVGIAHAAMTHGLTHAAILDFDLHHGDGSQAISWEQNRKALTASRNTAHHKKISIGYFSLHDINSYPCEAGDETKVRNASVCIDSAHGQSIWNVHLEPWKTTSEFWQLYDTKYSILIEKARTFLRLHTQRLLDGLNSPQPRAAVFLSSGFDASEWEGAGMQRHKVNVPTDFYARFTTDVVRLAEEDGLGVDGRIISVLEGGYSDRALTSGVLSHLSGLADPRGDVCGDLDQQSSRLASEMFNRLGLVNGAKQTESGLQTDPVAFDTEWWAPSSLEELEAVARPPPPPARKPREKGHPTYSSPTQASAAKVVTTPRERKSMTFQPGATDGMCLPAPVPEVNWATAAFEMSRILIPTDRQTLSCNHGELKAEVTRSRPERHATPSTPDALLICDRKHMQLRERKPKTPLLEENGARTSRSSSRSARRTTIASVSELPDPSAVAPSRDTCEELKVVTQGPRRLSVTSSVESAVSVIQGNGSHGKVPDVPSRSSSKGQIENRRSESLTSMRSVEALSTKKSRVTSTPRASAGGGRSSPRKAPPTPRIPPNQSSTRSVSSHRRSVSGTDSVQPKSLNTVEDSNCKDVDILTTGVKKLSIKLKVPTPEENAARELKAAEDRKRLVSKTPQKSQIGKIVKTPIIKASGKASRFASAAPVQVPLPTDLDTMKQDNSLHDLDASFEPQSHTFPAPCLASPPSSGNTKGEDITKWSARGQTDMEVTKIAHQPPVDEAPRPHNASAMSPPLTPRSFQKPIQPQITVKSPPLSAVYTKENLPVFTPTSSIPFAPPLDRDQNYVPSRPSSTANINNTNSERPSSS